MSSELCVRSMRAVSGRRHMGGQSLSQTTIGRRWLPCQTTHHLLSQPFISILFHLNRSICQVFFLSRILKSSFIYLVKNSISFQHFHDPNSISTLYHSSPGKWTSSVLWFLIDGLRNRDPRHRNSGQRRLDLQGVSHSGRQAPSLRRHCSTLCR